MSRAKRGATIAVAMGVMNVATYAFTVLAARVLGPSTFGAFAVAMNLLLVVSVIALGMQATAARRIARNPHHTTAVAHDIINSGRIAAAVTGAALLIGAPAVSGLLRFDSIWTAIVLGVAAVPLVLIGPQAGILQGLRRWTPLAWQYLAVGVGRLAVGAAFIWWRPDETAALVGVAIAAWIPVLIGAAALRGTSRVPAEHTSGIFREALGNSGTLLAFFALANADLVVARNVLDPHDAGLYAAGLILVKAVLFLPQFVVVLAFPSMGPDETRRRAVLLSLAAVTAVGLAVVAGVRLLSGIALEFVGGSAYSDVEGSLWLFAVLGTLVALLNMLAYSAVAQQTRVTPIALWVATAAVAIGGAQTSHANDLVVLVSAINAVTVTILLGWTLHQLRAPGRRPAVADVAPPLDGSGPGSP